MSRACLQLAGVCSALFFAGCAVIEPTDLDTKRVHAAVDEDPTTSIESLSTQLGISELAVVRAMPDAYARRWSGTPSEAWSAVSAWPVALVDTPIATYFGEPALVYIDAEEHTPLTKGNLFVDVKWAEIESVWLIRQPQANADLYAVWWFDDSGIAVFRVRLPVLWKEESSALTLYEQMWAKAIAQ